jgi:predicted TIM-barrel fold metal-dependent hydrolase
MPLCMHFGSSVMITLFACNSMASVTDLIFSAVFHRHPDLKIGMSEGGIGWIPYILERADYVWERHRHYQNVRQDVRP